MAKEELTLLKSQVNKNENSIHGPLSQFSQTPKQVDTQDIRSPTSRKRKQPHLRSYGMKRAEEVRANLDPKFPTLIKYMLPSHISSCFWLGLPLEFCKSYLPKHDETFILISENGKEYPVKYLSEKTGLSGGWRAFSLVHKLMEGDVLVFQLIKPTKFKVYIIRENASAEGDITLTPLDMYPRVRQTDPGKVIKTKTFQRKHLKSLQVSKNPKPLPASSLDVSCKSTSPTISCLDMVLRTEQAGNDNQEVNSEVKKDIRSSKSLEFKDIKALDNFTIMVNGLLIDPEIPKYVMTKYYDLCRSQNVFLHDHLPKVINYKLVAGIISETVNIADAIAASKLTTSQNEFTIWAKSLDAFQQLGMNVGFLQSRLHRLMYLASESEQSRDLKRYEEALLGQTQVDQEIRATELKLSELRESSKRFRGETEALKMKVEQHELNFHNEASARW